MLHWGQDIPWQLICYVLYFPGFHLICLILLSLLSGVCSRHFGRWAVGFGLQRMLKIEGGQPFQSIWRWMTSYWWVNNFWNPCAIWRIWWVVWWYPFSRTGQSIHLIVICWLSLSMFLAEFLWIPYESLCCRDLHHMLFLHVVQYFQGFHITYWSKVSEIFTLLWWRCIKLWLQELRSYLFNLINEEVSKIIC